MLDLLDEIKNEATSLQMIEHKLIPPELFRFLFIRLTQWLITRADKNKGKQKFWLKLLDRLRLGFDS